MLFDNAIFLITINMYYLFYIVTMGWIEWLNKEQYESQEPELRLDEQEKTPNLNTINWFKFDDNAAYFHVIKREKRTNEPWFQEFLLWIVELKKVDGKVIASYLKSLDWSRSIDPNGIPDSLTAMVEQKSKDIDKIPGNPDQATTIDVFADEETLVWDTKKELWTLYKEVNKEIPNN